MQGAEINAETCLYEPVKAYFEGCGYKVKAEVKSCDLAAVKDKRLVVAELKKSFCLKLVYQALERKSLTPFVYVVVPRPKSFRAKNVRMMVKLLKEIKVGLITVGIDTGFCPVEVILEPEGGKITNSKKRAAVLKEFNRRKTDLNLGGESSKGRIITAYRERSVELACIMEAFGEISLKLARELSSMEKPEGVLRTNCYNWFVRVKKGVYALSSQGRAALEDSSYADLTDFYRKEAEKKNV